MQTDSEGLDQGLRFCISHKPPHDADAAAAAAASPPSTLQVAGDTLSLAVLVHTPAFSFLLLFIVLAAVILQSFITCHPVCKAKEHANDPNVVSHFKSTF